MDFCYSCFKFCSCVILHRTNFGFTGKAGGHLNKLQEKPAYLLINVWPLMDTTRQGWYCDIHLVLSVRHFDPSHIEFLLFTWHTVERKSVKGVLLPYSPPTTHTHWNFNFYTCNKGESRTRNIEMLPTWSHSLRVVFRQPIFTWLNSLIQ